MYSVLSDSEDSLVKKATYLRIVARDLADGMKSGNFRSLYRGQGIEFSGVRDYIRGDDIRSIDWNVTARMGRPYVKIFEEERELQIFLIVDRSLSMQVGSYGKTKYDITAETAALLTIAAEMNNCPLGAVFFDGEIHFSCTPQLGRERTMLVLTHLDKVPENKVAGSVLSNAIKGAAKMLTKRSMVIILSDFRSVDWQKPMVTLAHENDVIAIRVKDKMDEELPRLGSVPFTDCETGETIILPSSSETFQKEWRKQNEKNVKEFQDFCIKHGVYAATLDTTSEPLQLLCSIFNSTKQG